MPKIVPNRRSKGSLRLSASGVERREPKQAPKVRAFIHMALKMSSFFLGIFSLFFICERGK